MLDESIEPQLLDFRDANISEGDWLNLMLELQIHSEGWEAAYLAKPNFAQDCDFVYTLNGKLIGIASGHRIQEQPLAYSLEVLGISPEHQGHGLGKKLLRTVCQTLPAGAIVSLYTQSKSVANWYDRMGWKRQADQSLDWKKSKSADQLTLTQGHRSGKAIWHYACSCPW